MKKIPGVLFLILSSLIGAVSLAHAEAKFEASLDRTSVALGERAQLGLTFQGTQKMPPPDIGNIDGIDSRYLGPSTMMTVINGNVSNSITHMYSVMPLRTGKFQLGPFTFEYEGVKYVSNMVFLQVAQERELSRQAAASEQEKLNLDDRIFLTLELGKTFSYVNELIPATIKLYVTRMNVRDIQLPIFTQEGFSKAEFKEPKQYREELNGVLYDCLEFNTVIFASRAGDYKVGPASIKCNVMVERKRRGGPSSIDDFLGNSPFRDDFFDDFFSRYELHPVELKTKDVSLVVSPLPKDGRPAGFQGAVGDFQFIFNAEPKKVKAGDPITLTMEINGPGNYNTVLMPVLEKTEGFKIYDPNVKSMTNTKIFTQVVIPENEKTVSTPQADFSYFNPDKKEYRRLVRGPLPIQVEKGEAAGAEVVGPQATTAYTSVSRDEERPARDIIFIKESIGRIQKRGEVLYRSRLFLAIVILPSVVFLVLLLFAAHRYRLEKNTEYASRMLARKMARTGYAELRRDIKKGDKRAFYEAVFRTLQGYFGSRMRLLPAGVTYETVRSYALHLGLDRNILERAKEIFERCDEARFAHSSSDEFIMENDLKLLESIIGHFERVRL